MADYISMYAGSQMDDADTLALNPDATPTLGSGNLVTSDGIARAVNAAQYSSAPAIVSTASGAVCSFPDGSASPMRSVIAQIVASQAGSGDPYPAGGGVNKWNPASFTTGTSNGITLARDGNDLVLTGTASAIAYFNHSGTDVDGSGTSVRLIVKSSAVNSGVMLRVVSSNGQSVNLTLDATEKAYTMSYTNGDTLSGYFQISGGTAISGELRVQVFAAAFTGTAPGYAPYSNIRPISGYAGANVTRAGRQLFDKNTRTSSAYIAADGTIGSSTSFSLTDYIKIGGEKVTISGNGSWGAAPSVCFFDANKNYISGTHPTTSPVTLDIPSGAVYMRSSLNTWSTTMIELGSTAHDYEAYNGEVFSVSWQDEAGTVYGGTVDLVSGVLTVTHFSETFNGSETWAPFGAIVGAYFHDLPDTEAQANKDDIIGNYIVATSKAGADLALFETTMQGPAGAYYRFIIQTGCATLAEWQTFLSNNNLQIVGETTGSTVYTLSPQEIVSLLGQNNIWNDVNGDTSAEYRADTKLYIDAKIAALGA